MSYKARIGAGLKVLRRNMLTGAALGFNGGQKCN